jgi:hypothetical protein
VTLKRTKSKGDRHRTNGGERDFASDKLPQVELQLRELTKRQVEVCAKPLHLRELQGLVQLVIKPLELEYLVPKCRGEQTEK